MDISFMIRLGPRVYVCRKRTRKLISQIHKIMSKKIANDKDFKVVEQLLERSKDLSNEKYYIDGPVKKPDPAYISIIAQLLAMQDQKRLVFIAFISFIITSVISFYTLKIAKQSKQISENTFRITYQDIKQRNRPFLSTRLISPLLNILDENEVLQNGVEFSMQIENHGEVPAYNVNRYLFAVADGQPIFGINVSTQNLTSSIVNGIPETRLTIIYTNNIPDFDT